MWKCFLNGSHKCIKMYALARCRQQWHKKVFVSSRKSPFPSHGFPMEMEQFQSANMWLLTSSLHFARSDYIRLHHDSRNFLLQQENSISPQCNRLKKNLQVLTRKQASVSICVTLHFSVWRKKRLDVILPRTLIRRNVKCDSFCDNYPALRPCRRVTPTTFHLPVSCPPRFRGRREHKQNGCLK